MVFYATERNKIFSFLLGSIIILLVHLFCLGRSAEAVMGPEEIRKDIDISSWCAELVYDQWKAVPINGKPPSARYKVITHLLIMTDLFTRTSVIICSSWIVEPWSFLLQICINLVCCYGFMYFFYLLIAIYRVHINM